MVLEILDMARGKHKTLYSLQTFDYLQGTICSEPCPAGMWGVNCQAQCKCYNGASCDRFTGQCACAPGFKGDR